MCVARFDEPTGYRAGFFALVGSRQDEDSYARNAILCGRLPRRRWQLSGVLGQSGPSSTQLIDHQGDREGYLVLIEDEVVIASQPLPNTIQNAEC